MPRKPSASTAASFAPPMAAPLVAQLPEGEDCITLQRIIPSKH
jgi:hypothetical protein